MKNLLKTSVFSFVLVSLVACEKSEDNTKTQNPTTNNDLKTEIVGSWEMESLEQKNGTMSTNGTQTGTFSLVAKNFKGAMIFNADGTTSSNIGYDADMKMIINIPGSPPQTVNQPVSIPQTSSTGTFEVISNTKLKMAGLGTNEMVVFDVTHFSASEMDLTTTVDTVLTQQGVQVGSTYDLYISLRKK